MPVKCQHCRRYTLPSCFPLNRNTPSQYNVTTQRTIEVRITSHSPHENNKADVDIRLHPRCAAACESLWTYASHTRDGILVNACCSLVNHLEYSPFSRCLFVAVTCKHYVIHKTESILIIQEAFEKCWAHSPLRAASRPFTRCR